ncbi:MAG: hypothetical protein AB7F41_10065 [Methylocystis sp.]|uniref:hypothetical protein n=1 Tax=Methylocystis sp. TaxID=1911079 RepID=UPI003D1057A7
MSSNPQGFDWDELDHVHDRAYALHLGILAIKDELDDFRAGPALIQLSMDIADQLGAILKPGRAKGAQEGAQ